MSELKYRQPHQYESITESMWNGQWTQAAIEAVKYGFYANDLMREYDSLKEQMEHYDDDNRVLEGFITVVEMAQDLRHADICDYRACPKCKETGIPLKKDELCPKCVEKSMKKKMSNFPTQTADEKATHKKLLDTWIGIEKETEDNE